MNAIKDDVIALVHKELESANKMFPLFHSSHEAYAIIKEEVEETEEQLVIVNRIKEMMWKNIRNNNIHLVITNTSNLKKHAINTAIEAIQVAAMAQKLLDSAKDSVEITESKEDRREIVDI